MSVETSAGTSVNGDVPVTVKPTPTATLDTIASTLVSEKSPVSEHAIAQAEADAAARVGTDAEGNSFDPAIHAVNQDGSPRKKANGAYALKRGKKSNASQNGATQKDSQSVKGIVVPGTISAKDAKAQECRASGVGAANLMFALAIGIGGQEWAPRIDEKTGLNEKLMMEGAHADAFEAWGWGDLPPGLALAAAYCMYALPRLQMPQTRTRVSRVKIWFGTKLATWRANRKAKKRGLPESDVERADRQSREMYQTEKNGNGSTVRQS